MAWAPAILQSLERKKRSRKSFFLTFRLGFRLFQGLGEPLGGKMLKIEAKKGSAFSAFSALRLKISAFEVRLGGVFSS